MFVYVIEKIKHPAGIWKQSLSVKRLILNQTCMHFELCRDIFRNTGLLCSDRWRQRDTKISDIWVAKESQMIEDIFPHSIILWKKVEPFEVFLHGKVIREMFPFNVMRTVPYIGNKHTLCIILLFINEENWSDNKHVFSFCFRGSLLTLYFSDARKTWFRDTC